jgi:hypothetical protein
MESKEILVDPEKVEWETINLPGIKIKYLYKNTQTGASLDYYGQLGDGSNIDRLTPVPVSGLSNVVAIAAGEEHSMAR